MMTSSSSPSIVYLLLIYIQGVMHVPSGPLTSRHGRALFVDFEFYQKYWSASVKPAQCDNDLNHLWQDNELSDNLTIFTQDLPAKTNYKVYSNKQYSLNHPNVDFSDKEKLNIIVVPHSHVDAGWLRTVEEYYIYHVKSILNNMIKKLKKYENMTFVWAETVFLSIWWNELDDEAKLQVRRLIRNGQLEIVLGGWVMSDEASTHYPSVIDQLMEGHQWVWEHLQTKPINSWAIDPFGHSGTMPYLWKQAGIDNMVIQRVHQAIKATLANEKALEFKWRQNWDLTGSTDILCHVMPYLYYGMQYTCGPDKKVCAMYDYGKPRSLEEKYTGKEINDGNIAAQAKHLYQQYKMKASLFKYHTILVPVGDDFRFDTAEEWDLHYNNYMKVMEYINNRTDWNMNVQFGTLKHYFEMLRNEEKIKLQESSPKGFSILKGDFYPYSDQNSDYWTGYYSTRPFHKQLSREIENNLLAADTLSSLAYAQCKLVKAPYESYHDVASQLQTVRRNLGLFLHHDAITGTAKPSVVQDYESKLLTAYNLSLSAISSTIQTLLTNCEYEEPVVLSPVNIRRDSHTPPTRYTIKVTKSGISVIYFNPLAQDRTEFVSLAVHSSDIEIRNSKNQTIPFQINPSFESTMKIRSSEFEIVFLVEIPPFGIETYTLFKVETSKGRYWSSIETFDSETLHVSDSLGFKVTNGVIEKFIENDFVKIVFDEKGLLTGIHQKVLGKVIAIKLDFMSYISGGSGAYVFYPSGVAKGILTNLVPVIRIVKGPFLEQINVVYKQLVHSLTLYNTLSVQGQGIHIENILDMNKHDMADQEVIMRVYSDVSNPMGLFYTDQNGFQLIGRKTNFESKIETNYYPATSMVVLEDEVKRLTIHTRQSHGVASLKQGWLEIMLDRKVMSDDKKGLGEGVWDNRPTVSNFIIQIEHKDVNIPVRNFRFTYPSIVSNVINEHLQRPLQTVFTIVHNNVFQSKFHPLNKSMPCDLSIVSLKNLVNSNLHYNRTSVILHKKAYSCDFASTGLQCPINYMDHINLQLFFPNSDIYDARETTLTHLNLKKRLSASEELQLSTMSLNTFLLTL